MITGSGKFVAVAASNTQIDSMFSTPMTGITFGIGSNKYCQITSKYEVELLTVTGTAFCVEPGVANGRVYIGFQNIPKISVNNYTGYTGSLTVLSDCEVDEVTGLANPSYALYAFESGLFILY